MIASMLRRRISKRPLTCQAQKKENLRLDHLRQKRLERVGEHFRRLLELTEIAEAGELLECAEPGRRQQLQVDVLSDLALRASELEQAADLGDDRSPAHALGHLRPEMADAVQ